MANRITAIQAETLYAQLGSGFRYLVKLRQRMEAASMTSDPLFDLAKAAEEASRQLSMALNERERERERTTDRRPWEIEGKP